MGHICLGYGLVGEGGIRAANSIRVVIFVEDWPIILQRGLDDAKTGKREAIV